MKKLLFTAIAAITLMAGTCTTQETPDPGPKMVSVTGRTFTMGEAGVAEPTFSATLSNFSIGMYQVTQKEWKDVMNALPTQITVFGDNLPVTYVNWEDIVGTTGASIEIKGITYYSNGFIYKLNQKFGKSYRLPTEAEWEYAARGGHRATTPGKTYSGSNTLDEVGWYDNNSGGQLHEVGKKAANELGIFDMSGNVYEWCSDRYADYTATAKTNPHVLTGDSERVLRGGSWNYDASDAHVSNRSNSAPSYRSSYVGFRLAL